MIDVAWKVGAFLVVLGVLVVFHELGHYLVARLCGVKVLRFSVGFGRVIWSRRVGADRTEWAVSAVPLGGYVKMADEREDDLAPEDVPRAFNRQGVGKRIAIVAAGPIANLLLAVVLFAGTFVVGVPGQRAILAPPQPGTAAAAAGFAEGDRVVAVDGDPVASLQDLRWRVVKSQGRASIDVDVERADGSRSTRILPVSGLTTADWEANPLSALGLRADLGAPIVDQVSPGKPAEVAGMRAGDRIVAVDGRPARSPADVANATNAKPGVPIVFRIARGGGESDVTVVPEASEQGGRRVGLAGLRLKVDPESVQRIAITVRSGPLDALGQGARKTWELSTFTLRMLGRMVTGDASLKNLSGPITLADFAGQSAQAGALVFVGYLALISISLGVLNLLPIPLLDGGHLLYYLAEIILGRPVSDRAFEVGQRIGMALLAVLMTLALVNDVSRLF
ncbi:MAG: RIP metalloprotease RseP [Betaproteobacteria bacterium]|nr:RIP metalloprotease RseP [Betaproteobacteria bacterium]